MAKNPVVNPRFSAIAIVAISIALVGAGVLQQRFEALLLGAIGIIVSIGIVSFDMYVDL